MKFYFFRIFVILLLIFGYSGVCSSMYDLSMKNVESYSLNQDNLKVSSNDVQILNEDILGSVRIPKINVDNKLYKIGSSLNNVDKNIEVLDSSDMPDVSGGNFILASHNGFSPIAYFHNLDKLDIGDEVYVGYNDTDYKYVVADIYDVVKTGKVEIKRDKSKNTITMITCKGEDKQLVVIGYLK